MVGLKNALDWSNESIALVCYLLVLFQRFFVVVSTIPSRRAGRGKHAQGVSQRVRADVVTPRFACRCMRIVFS